jgi:flagellar capping protein FliD
MVDILAPISVGELIDKITILRIKRERIRGAAAQANIARELESLLEIRARAGLVAGDVDRLEEQLFQVNGRLWDIEDQLRSLERENKFPERFIELARSVYRLNDQRSTLKRKINKVTGSAIVEEKSYHSYE